MNIIGSYPEYGPVGTFAFYILAILLVFTVIAFAADEWTKKVERDARRQARAEARAQRRRETETSHVEWQS